VILVSGGLVLPLAMGLRHGFGLFLQPMSADLHWGRETFALRRRPESCGDRAAVWDDRGPLRHCPRGPGWSRFSVFGPSRWRMQR
jgi:hypothetical protein